MKKILFLLIFVFTCFNNVKAEDIIYQYSDVNVEDVSPQKKSDLSLSLIDFYNKTTPKEEKSPHDILTIIDSKIVFLKTDTIEYLESIGKNNPTSEPYGIKIDNYHHILIFTNIKHKKADIFIQLRTKIITGKEEIHIDSENKELRTTPVKVEVEELLHIACKQQANKNTVCKKI